MNVEKLIELRRNVKPNFFSRESILDEDVKKLLESANWAPTHGYTEPWRFVVFSGSARMDFANFQASLYQTKSSSESFNNLKHDKLLKTPLLASHIIAIIACNSEDEKIPFIEEIVATSCAVQNILLNATQMKIAIHWTSGGMTYEPEMKRYLGFDSKDQLLGFLYLGKSDEHLAKKGKRMSTIHKKIIWKN